MGEQVLAPSVENGENPNLRAQVLGIGSDFQKGGGAGREQQVVKHTSIILCQEIELVGDREDDVEVVRGQEFALAGRQPAFPCLGLALGTVPIATRNGEISITCLDRHRGRSRPRTPATPPCVRVRTRRFERLR